MNDPGNVTPVPGFKRVIVTLNVPADYDKHDLASFLDLNFTSCDPTVWEWAGFWQDVADGQVSPAGDLTAASNDASPEVPKWVVDDQHGVGAGQRVPIIGVFDTEQQAADFIDTLPDKESGRYGISGPADEEFSTNITEQETP